MFLCCNGNRAHQQVSQAVLSVMYSSQTCLLDLAIPCNRRFDRKFAIAHASKALDCNLQSFVPAGELWRLVSRHRIGDAMFASTRFFCFVCTFFVLARCSANQQFASKAVDAQTNYADVRHRVQQSFPEKNNEILNIIDVLQDITRSTLEMSSQISSHCS